MNERFLKEKLKLLITELKNYNPTLINKIDYPIIADSNTNGKVIEIGNFGKKLPRLQVWYDLFLGYEERKFYIGLYSPKKDQISAIAKSYFKQTKSSWKKIKIINDDDICNDEKYDCLNFNLKKSDFNVPVIENYKSGKNYFGIYTQFPMLEIDKFMELALDFYISIPLFECNSKSIEDDLLSDIYASENRKMVKNHISRDRSHKLSFIRKKKDRFECQICGFKFSDKYGPLGNSFAESHHIIALSKSDKIINSTINDLITVCSNCHRMLHKMSGKPEDISDLKRLIKNKNE